MSLIGRDRERLEDVAAAARAQGAEVEPRCSWTCAIRTQWRNGSRRPTRAALRSRHRQCGDYDGSLAGRDREDPGAVRAIIGINLIGVLNTVEPLIAPMCARGAGQLAFIGSIAGLRGLPYSPSYCATKAAVHAYSESLRGRLAASGVQVSSRDPWICEDAVE